MKVFRIKRFSLESKALWTFAPGAYQAKEAGKYAYGSDSKEYRKKRAGLAVKGFFTPITATVVNQKAKKMAEEGRSQKEIRDYIEGRGKYSNSKRIAGGVGEVVGRSIMPITGVVGSLAAHGAGLVDKLEHNRADDLEERRKNKKKH